MFCLANSCCVDFNAFMVACGTVEGEVQLFDFENRVKSKSHNSDNIILLSILTLLIQLF